MRIISVIAVLALMSALAQPASAGMKEDCNQGDDRDLQIGGCTAVIRSGEFSGENLAIAYNNRGLAYNDLGEHRRAIKNFDQALRIDPGLAKAYNNRGVAYRKLGEFRRAIEDYGQAIQLDPGYALAHRNRGRTYHRLGEYRQAIKNYDQALRINPGYAIAYQNRGALPMKAWATSSVPPATGSRRSGSMEPQGQHGGRTT